MMSMIAKLSSLKFMTRNMYVYEVDAAELIDQ